MYYAKLTAETIEDLAGLPILRTTDGQDWQQDNNARATRAAHILATYARRTKASSEDLDTVILDMLADLMHLCDALDLDIYELVDRAEVHHTAETRGEF